MDDKLSIVVSELEKRGEDVLAGGLEKVAGRRTISLNPTRLRALLGSDFPKVMKAMQKATEKEIARHNKEDKPWEPAGIEKPFHLTGGTIWLDGQQHLTIVGEAYVDDGAHSIEVEASMTFKLGALKINQVGFQG